MDHPIKTGPDGGQKLHTADCIHCHSTPGKQQQGGTDSTKHSTHTVHSHRPLSPSTHTVHSHRPLSPLSRTKPVSHGPLLPLSEPSQLAMVHSHPCQEPSQLAMVHSHPCQEPSQVGHNHTQPYRNGYWETVPKKPSVTVQSGACYKVLLLDITLTRQH